ncbi:MAG: hypothetical protein ACRD88_02045 [Terriglobia bacterium]
MSEQDTNPPPDISADPLAQYVRALHYAPQDQRSIILLSHGVLELLINGLIDARCKNSARITSDNRGYPHSTRLLILHEIGVIDDQAFRRLEWFRKLRNKAAHEPLFRVTAGDLAGLATRYRDPEKLNKLCEALVVSFWNTHVDDLLPRFAPSLIEAHAIDLARRGKLPNKRVQRTHSRVTPRAGKAHGSRHAARR